MEVLFQFKKLNNESIQIKIKKYIVAVYQDNDINSFYIWKWANRITEHLDMCLSEK